MTNGISGKIYLISEKLEYGDDRRDEPCWFLVLTLSISYTEGHHTFGHEDSDFAVAAHRRSPPSSVFARWPPTVRVCASDSKQSRRDNDVSPRRPTEHYRFRSLL